MDNKVSWSNPMTTYLIRLYKRNEFLYDKKHQDYKNRKKRIEAYIYLGRKISRKFRVRCNEADIKKKINGLRTQYQTEKNKVNIYVHIL